MKKVIVSTLEGSYLAVLYVEGKVEIKETNGVRVEVEGEGRSRYSGPYGSSSQFTETHASDRPDAYRSTYDGIDRTSQFGDH